MDEALRLAGATAIVDVVGLHATLGRYFDDSTDISVGQWQRVALARAIFRSSPIFIFDEPTSSLDPLAETAFMTDLLNQLRGATILVVSHRMAMARHADRILVMQGGGIVQDGDHQSFFDP